MTIATIAVAQQNFGKGQGIFLPAIGGAPGTITAAAANSGGMTIQYNFNSIGTTLPATRVGHPLPPGDSNLVMMEAYLARSTATNLFLAWVYTIGTLNLAAVGDQFTHNAATFPLLRTEFGEASRPITLLPTIYITTATTTTAAVFSMKTNAGGAGYTDQDGNATVANVLMTLPAAATAVQSSYIFRLNSGDCGVRDINQIDVDTAAAAGAATIFGIEIIADIANYPGQGGLSNVLVNGLQLSALKPAVATSGTATAVLALIALGTGTSGAGSNPVIVGALNV